jgi:hypothetical protein
MPIHPHLPGAAQLLDRALRHAGKMAAEPAVQPNIGFIFTDGARGNGHGAG